MMVDITRRRVAFGVGLLLLATSTTAATYAAIVTARQDGDPHGPAPLASIAVDRNGRIWRLAVSDGRLALDYSDDVGRTFTGRTHVTTADEKVDPRPETRPRVWVDASGRRWITYERLRGRLYTGDIVVRRVEFGGRVSDPVVINDNVEDIGHTYHTSGLDAAGHLFVVWLDDRGGNHIPENGGRPRARGMYYAVMQPGGPLSTPVNHLVAPDRVCDCCRPAIAFGGRHALLFARLATADGLRDHASYRLGLSGLLDPARPGPVDGWRIEACPHHGPAVGVGAGGRYHVVWFTGSESRQGLFYAYSTDEGRSYQGLRAVGNAARQAGHPDVLVEDRRAYVAWTERTGRVSRAWVQRSDDGGATWSAARAIAEAEGAVDYAFLHRAAGRVLLSWSTARRGLLILDAENSTASGF